MKVSTFCSRSRTKHRRISAYLSKDERFADIDFKESYSEHQPFNRMNVRLKNEIISVGLPNFDRVEPETGRILPKELHEKLVNGDDVVSWILATPTKHD